MSNSLTITPLKVVNEGFLVSSMIERCPKTMMIRELVMNGAGGCGPCADRPATGHHRIARLRGGMEASHLEYENRPHRGGTAASHDQRAVELPALLAPQPVVA